MDLQIGAAIPPSNRQLPSGYARKWPASPSLILLFISQTKYKDMTETSSVSTVVVVGLAGFAPAISWVDVQGLWLPSHAASSDFLMKSLLDVASRPPLLAPTSTSIASTLTQNHGQKKKS